jgi:hypothetical protein
MKTTDPYSPTIDPAAFSATIDNPYLPMVPGTRTIYEAHTPDGLQQTTTEVTPDTKMIMGVKTVVVHDTVRVLPKGRVPDVANQDGGQQVPSAMLTLNL